METTEEYNLNVIELLKRINDTIEKNANSNLLSNNITLSQLKMLFMILESECSPEKSFMPLKELERRSGVAQSTAAGIIQRLEKKGLVESVVNTSDKRVKILKTTQTGRSICTKAVKSMDEVVRSSLEEFIDDEKNELERLLKKLLKNLA